MKKSLFGSPQPLVTRHRLRALFFLLALGFLAATLWIATTPATLAHMMSPTEMIQEELPQGKTMRTATKPEFLSAVCAAVKRHRPAGPQIVRTAVALHHEYSGDIVATVLRCGTSVDCAYVGSVVSAAVAVAPDQSAAISDAAIAIAPDCADAIQAATQSDIPGEGPGTGPGGINQAPLPGSPPGGGGGVNPQQQLILVCDNGSARNVPEGQLGDFLRSHPGSFVGSCQATPTANR